jgi:hypothetical protein
MSNKLKELKIMTRNNNSINRRSTLLGAFSIIIAFVLMMATNLQAQDYEMTINQRRMGSQIGAEIWVKSLTTNNPKLGQMTIPLLYNDDFLKPAAKSAASGLYSGNPATYTDSIYYDVNVAQPYVTINAPYGNNNFGFDGLNAQAVVADNGTITAKAYVLQVNYQPGGMGYTPEMSGKGTLVGVLKFDIINAETLSDSDMTDIEFNTAYAFAPTLIVLDTDGNDVSADVSLEAKSPFAVRDITILSPNLESMAIKRHSDPNLASIDGNPGYPIYFERSGLLKDIETYGAYGTPTLAYSFALSLDNGSNWNEMGRFTETELAKTTMGTDLSNYVDGEIAVVSDLKPYYVTLADGTVLPDAASRPENGYGGILRFIWEGDETYAYRSEEAKLRMTQLEADDATKYSEDLITNRNSIVGDGRYDATDASFVLGRMFFAQLNGTDEYFRTKENFSTPSIITIEAWVNLNEAAADNAEPAILASGTPTAQNEGPWMLYLKNGVYPAFRCYKEDGEATGEILADIVSPTPLTVVSSDGNLSYSHGDNWVHLAATVEEGTAKLLINGEVVAQYTNTSNNVVHLSTMKHPIYVGVNPNNNGITTPENYVKAGIKEVKVWKTALSQDEIRKYLAGVYEPSNIDNTKNDDRQYLMLYYPLQAAHEDLATDDAKQWGAEELDFYVGTNESNETINFRPDRAHIKLTSPIGGEGITNLEGETFEVRWAGYGLGSVNPNTADLQIMISRDGGATWFDAIGEETFPAKMLDRVEIEDGAVLWSPFNNATVQDYENDLQSLVSIDRNYSKKCIMKISGTEADGLEDIVSISDTFTIAPHFAFANTGTARVTIEGNKNLAFTGSTNMIEAWVKPYNFPTAPNGEYPIFSKKDGTDNHYTLSITHEGRLQLKIYDTESGTDVVVTSSENHKLLEPFSLENEATWTHVAAWVNLADGGTSTSARFYIDGIMETVEIGEKVIVDRNCSYPNFIGFEPNTAGNTDGEYFNGELKEVRFWGGNPGGVDVSGVEPSDLTLFIQGAQGIRANELIEFAGIDYQQNLVAAWSFDGGSWVNSGIQNSIAVFPEVENEALIAVVYGDGFSYEATKPFIKLVEPVRQQQVSNRNEDLRVRWVGWDYDRNDGTAPFRNGSDAANEADLSFSTGGGSGTDNQPYEPVASQNDNDSYNNAMMFNYLDRRYEFLGTASRTQYAIDLDMSMTDPDINGDFTKNDQGPIDATQNNGRFKLEGRATMNGTELTYSNSGNGIISGLRSESKLFNITPPSNFTVRVLLEGYHTGTDAATGGIQARLGNTFEQQGLSIKLYENQANTPGSLIVSNESVDGYYNVDAKKIANYNAGENNYANVPFVFTDLANERYYVTVDHINHLPVTSAYAAPFIYVGDDENTWEIESGWDFTTWNGVSGNDLSQADAAKTIPEMGDKYGAKGPSENNPDEGDYSRKQLIYNNGRNGDLDNNQLPAMIGGDVYRDGKIDALDRNFVNESVGGFSNEADVTGDGVVNSADRIIVYRNDGIQTSPGDHPQGSVIYPGGPAPISAPLEMADYRMVNSAATAQMVRAQQDYFENGGTTTHKLSKKYNLMLQSKDEVKYEVYAETRKLDQYVDVEIFIKNTGSNWALGNSTFGLEYDPSKLEFDTYYGEDQVMFSSSSQSASNAGYNRAYSNPIDNTVDPLPGLRTIDIVHGQDAPGTISGVEVPNQMTSLGTLRFIINRTADYNFKWHKKVTNVNDVDGLDVTTFGIFKQIESIELEKNTELTYPTAGAELSPNRAYSIQWTEPTYNDVMIDLLLSVDNGATWEVVNSNPISIADREYYWVTPKVNSPNCKLKMREVETESIIDEMTNTFAILAAPVDIIKPCAACGNLIAGTTTEIVWASDREDQIFFEFSVNGTTNWTKITDEMICNKTITSWVVPEVNTANAVIRMKTTEGKVIATSTPFSILTGSLAIENPNNTIIKGGKVQNVTWSYDNVEAFDLAYSLDNGATWNVIAEGINTNSQSFDWTVPNKSCDIAMLKAYYPSTPELAYNTVNFVIVESASSVESPAALGYTLSSAVPNPFHESATMTFTTPKTANVTVKVYDLAGNEVVTVINNQLFAQGKHGFTVDAEHLLTGTYIVYVNVGEYTLTQRILVIK